MVIQDVERSEETTHELPFVEPTKEQQYNELRNLEPLPGETQVRGIAVCNAGTSRSALMDELLDARNYNVSHYGVAGSAPFGDELIDELAAGRVQFIVCATQGIADKFNQRFAELAEQKGSVLNVPIRAINLSEGAGIGWWRTHREKANEAEDDGTSPYHKADYIKVVDYLNSSFDDLGLVDRTPQPLLTKS